MIRTTFAALALSTTFAVAALAGGETPSNPDAEVFFVNIADGDTLSSPLMIEFGLSGMEVAPAGTETPMTGHHHLLINRPPLGEGEGGADELAYGLPADENHVHFGGGQTETTIELPPGEHTLQLVLGDSGHVPHAIPIMSEVITITIE